MIDLRCGDCLEILPTLPDNSVRLILADPPYNNGTQYSGYNDKRDDYKDWCEAWFAECRRVAERVIITPGHGNLWMWGEIERPWGIGSWYKPGNPSGSVLGWVCWEPWLYYCKDYKALGGPDTVRATVSKQDGVGSHPCPKPISLLVELLKKASREGDTILDPFMGSGTTGMACLELGRSFIGIEQSPEYFEISKRRIEQAQAQGVLQEVAR